MTAADDRGLLGGPRRDGPLPKLVVVGIAWAAIGVVALITAVLMRSLGIAVFGVLCVLAGGGLWFGQRTRERLAHDEEMLSSGPIEFDPDPGADDDVVHGEPDDDRHATRVMPTDSDDSDDSRDPNDSRGSDDIVDAEYDEYIDYEPSPSDQDDGTGYDDDEMAYRRRREDEWAREAREHEAARRAGEVIEADEDESADDDSASDGHGDRDPVDDEDRQDGRDGDRSGTRRDRSPGEADR